MQLRLLFVFYNKFKQVTAQKIKSSGCTLAVRRTLPYICGACKEEGIVLVCRTLTIHPIQISSHYIHFVV